MTKCTTGNCERPSVCRTLCRKHYYKQWLKVGSQGGKRRYFTCTLEGCGRPHSALGYCKNHYRRYKRYGDPLFKRLPPQRTRESNAKAVRISGRAGHNVKIPVQTPQTKRPTYNSEKIAWSAMKNRCYNPKDVRYDRYGGRGIGVCGRWLYSFEYFLEDMGKKPTPDHTLDRINNDGDYEPGNCRWATRRQQNANRSISSKYPGVYKSGTRWAAQIKVGKTNVFLKYYVTRQQALKARKRAEREHLQGVLIR